MKVTFFSMLFVLCLGLFMNPVAAASSEVISKNIIPMQVKNLDKNQNLAAVYVRRNSPRYYYTEEYRPYYNYYPSQYYSNPYYYPYGGIYYWGY